MNTSTAPFTIRELDLFNDADLATMYQLEQERLTCTPHSEKDTATFADVAEELRELHAGKSHVWGAFRDGRPIASAVALLPVIPQDDPLGALITIHVAPDEGDDDVAVALLERLENQLLPSGTGVTLGVAQLPGDGASHPVRKAASRRGYTPERVVSWCERALPLDAADQETLQQEVAALVTTGNYRIASFVGGVPQEYRDAVCEMTSLAEHEEDPQLPHDPFTADDYVEELREDAGGGWQRIETLAITSDDQVVGMVRVDGGREAPEHPLVYNFTYVRDGHRGHRLGLAMNLDVLRTAARVWPEHRSVLAESDHAHTFTHAMLTQLGYVAQRVETTLKKQR